MTALIRPDTGLVQISDYVSENGMALNLPLHFEYSQADAVLSSLWTTKDLSQFYIGDLLNHVENMEYYSQLLDEKKYKKRTVDNCKRVARNVKDRWENLSFDHHSSVSALEPEDQTKWLKYASEGAWTTAKLREELRDTGLITRQKRADKPKVITCPHCDRAAFEDIPCTGCMLDVEKKEHRKDLEDIKYGEQAPPPPDWVIEICDKALGCDEIT